MLPSAALRYSNDIGSGPESGSVFRPRPMTPRIPERSPTEPGIGTGAQPTPLASPTLNLRASPGMTSVFAPRPTDQGPRQPIRGMLR